MRYSVHSFQLAEPFVAELSKLNSRRTYWALAGIWALVLVTILFAGWLRNYSALTFWLLYPIFGFFIAGRQGALLQVVHEGCHRLISKQRKVNDFLANWLAALPVGLTLEGYTKGHMQHHAFTGTPQDAPNDLEKHQYTDIRDPRLHLLFLRDISGITALHSFLGHSQNGEARQNVSRSGLLLRLCVAQATLLLIVFQLNLVNYVLLWLIPVATFNMVLMRVRGIAEHGLPDQLGIEVTKADLGNFHTRSVSSVRTGLFPALVRAVETLLIGSLSCNYHHEHHLLPRVPFYHLSKLHDVVRPEVLSKNSAVYLDSYFGALFLKTRFAGQAPSPLIIHEV